MTVPFFIFKKYIRSKKESKFISLISVISIIGIALGVTVLITALAVLHGFENTISDKIVKFNSHLVITSFGNRNLPDYNAVVPRIEKRLGKNLKSISPFVSKLAIIRSRKFTEGVTINGILPEMDNSNISDFIIAGKYDLRDTSEISGMVIGKKLAEKLLINLGDKVTVFGIKKDQIPTPDNPPAIRQFIITGIYESGMAEYDDLNAYINLHVAQEMFGLDKQVSGYNIRVTNLAVVDSLSDDIQNFLRYPYYARSIFNIHQSIFTWLELQKKPIPIVLGLIIFVAVFNVVGTLLMMVLERVSDIGILRSMGANRKQIVRIFLYQGIYLALIGIIAGNILSFVLSFLQEKFKIISLPESIYFVSSVPIIIEWQVYLLVSTVTLLLCITASIIPSLIASNIKPISALRFE